MVPSSNAKVHFNFERALLILKKIIVAIKLFFFKGANEQIYTKNV